MMLLHQTKGTIMDYLAELEAIRTESEALAAKETELRERRAKVFVLARKASHTWVDLQKASGMSPEGVRQAAMKANKGVLPMPRGAKK